MDRGRYRAVLSVFGLGGSGLLALAGSLLAQSPAPTPVPTSPAAATSTPWVQASPPPLASPARLASVTIRVDKESRYFFDKEKEALSADALSGRLHKLHEAQGDDLRVFIRAEQDANYGVIVATLDRVHDAGFSKNVALSVSPGKGEAASPPPSPAASPSREETARSMARKREEELAKVPSSTPVKPPRAEGPLPSDEREAYERNLGLWLALPPEERQALRGQATERIREETERAYASSGLNLNDDQREVFALRYRQERRRLEREIQEKAKVERARRLPEIMDRLKHEFPSAPPGATSPRPTPVSTATAAPSPAK